MIWDEFDIKLIMVNLFVDIDRCSLTEKATVRDRGPAQEASGEAQVTYTINRVLKSYLTLFNFVQGSRSEVLEQEILKLRNDMLKVH